MCLQSGALMLEAVLCTVVNILFCWLQVMAAIHVWWCVQGNVMLILSGIPVTLLPRPAYEGAPEAPPRHFVGNMITFIPAFESKSTGDCWTVTGHTPHWVGWHSDGVDTNGVWDVCTQPAPPCAGCSNVKSRVV